MDPVIGTLLLVLAGVLVKYAPWLKPVSNRLIPWINLLLAFAMKLAGPDTAHAGGFFSTVGSNFGWFLPVLQTMLARIIYETWGRPSMEMVAPKTEKKAVGHPI